MRTGLPRLDDGVGGHLGLEHPVAYLCHVGGAVVAEEGVGRHLAMRVQDVAVEGEARQECVLVDGQLVVVGRVGEVGPRAVVVVFGQLLHVVRVVAAVDGRAVGAGSHVAVHHAHGYAHAGGIDRRGAADGALVVAHDAGGVCAANNGSVAVAVHHAHVTARVSDPAHQATHVARALYGGGRRGQHAAVVHLGVARGGDAHGAGVGIGTCTVDVNVIEPQVLHRGPVEGVEERNGEAADGVVASVEGAGEVGERKTAEARGVDVGCQDIVAAGRGDLRQAGDGGLRLQSR